MITWICGLSGAGKSSLGKKLYEQMKQSTSNLVLLDGDELRAAYGDNLGHDNKSRAFNSLRIANLCHLLDRQGIHVICCAVTITQEVQILNRERCQDYREVYLRVNLGTLKTRDPKGIYRRAALGEEHNVAGVDIPYAAPAKPHLTIDNDQDLDDLSSLVDKVLEIVPKFAN